MEPLQRRIIVLGSTGSIGRNCLDVIEHLNTHTPHQFEVVGLAAGSNVEVLRQQANRFNVPNVVINDEHAPGLDSFSDRVNVMAGADRLCEMVATVDADVVVGAIVGSAGLPATMTAIEHGRDIALANKETLVAAGDVVMDAVKKHDVRLLPIDSEHSAILQSLQSSGPQRERDVNAIARLVLTASGGPFRTWTRERMEHASVDQALAHPTWDMGAKITIDSATLFNKALEMIEAHWLFDLPEDQIEVIVHPQSIVHSFVEFVDGSVVAQLGPPDMKTPIQYALTYPSRASGCGKRLDWTTLQSLEFEPPDLERFPALSLARDVIRLGGSAGAVFNAANEQAVEFYLHHRIGLLDIPSLVAAALAEIPNRVLKSINEVMGADAEAREFVVERVLSGKLA